MIGWERFWLTSNVVWRTENQFEHCYLAEGEKGDLLES
jgi:hypothetical protein